MKQHFTDLKIACGGWGKERGEECRGVQDETRILLHLKWMTNKDTACLRTLNALRNSGWMGGEFEGEWIHAYA